MATTVEIEWERHDQLIIRDIHEKWHERIRNFMLEKSFKQNPLFKYLEYPEDSVDQNEYLKYVEHVLNDECSIVALNKRTDEIFAVALVKCMTKEWRSWTALQMSIDECKFLDYIELQYRMLHQYASEYPDEPFDSLHLFEYYVNPVLRFNSEFMRKFFLSIFETASHMRMSRVTYLALSAADQEEVYEQGFQQLSYAIYSVFTLRNRRPFARLRDIEEMEAVLFQIEVEPIIPYNEMMVRGIDDVVAPVERRTTVAAIRQEHSVHSVDE